VFAKQGGDGQPQQLRERVSNRLPVADSVRVEPCKENHQVERFGVGLDRIHRFAGAASRTVTPHVLRPACSARPGLPSIFNVKIGRFSGRGRGSRRTPAVGARHHFEELAFARLRDLQNPQLALINVTFDTLANDLAELLGRDGVKLDRAADDFFDLVSVILVGRDGRSHSSTWERVTAGRSKWISASGA
jgi:hypothetical protein